MTENSVYEERSRATINEYEIVNVSVTSVTMCFVALC